MKVLSDSLLVGRNDRKVKSTTNNLKTVYVAFHAVTTALTAITFSTVEEKAMVEICVGVTCRFRSD